MPLNCPKCPIAYHFIQSRFQKINLSTKSYISWPSILLRLCLSPLTFTYTCFPVFPTLACVCVQSLSHVCLCDPMDCSPPRLLCPWNFLGKNMEWVAISYSRGSSQPRDWSCVSGISCSGPADSLLYRLGTATS